MCLHLKLNSKLDELYELKLERESLYAENNAKESIDTANELISLLEEEIKDLIKGRSVCGLFTSDAYIHSDKF